MPIYEYMPIRGETGCSECSSGFEIIQGIRDEPLRLCPLCQTPLVRVISLPSFRVAEANPISPAEERIRDYEKKGMYSHAAELADKVADKTKKEDLKTRALEDYKKAGYKDL